MPQAKVIEPEFLRPLHQKLMATSEYLALGGVTILVILACYTSLDIILRLFGVALAGSVDIVSYGMAIAVAAAMPYGFLSDQHISISVALDKLSGGLRAIVAAITTAVSTVFLAWLAWSTLLYTADRKAVHDTMWILDIEIWPIWSVLTALFAFTFLISVFQTTVAIRTALKSHRQTQGARP